MEIPRWQRQVTPAGTAGGAMADPGALSRPTEGLKILGQVATEAGEQWAYKLDNLIANNQLGAFELEARRAFNEMDPGTDPAGYEAKYDEMLEKVRTEHLEKVTHPEARRAAEAFLSGKDVEWRLGVRKMASDTIIKQGGELYAATRKLAVERGDADLLTTATRRAIASGVIGPELGEVNLAADLGAMAKDTALSHAKRIFDRTGSLTQAIEAIQTNPDVRETDKDALFEDVRTYSATMKAGAELAAFREKEDFKKELIKLKFSDNPADLVTARNMVRGGQSPLTAEEMQKELDDIGGRARAMAEGKDDPLKQSNPATYFEFARRIQTSPESVSEGQIADAVGKGISVTDYEKLTGQLDGVRKGALDNVLVKSLLADLDNRHRAGYFLDRPFRRDPDKESEMSQEEFVRSQQTLAAIHKQFTDWVKANPQATDAQIGEKYRALLDPANDELELLGLETAWTKEGRRQRLFAYLRGGGAAGAAGPAGTATAKAVTPEMLDGDYAAIWREAKADGVAWEDFIRLLEEGGR
jgi:hypothetical protein